MMHGSIRSPVDTKVVLPDCRFPNEAAAVWALGGQVWRTERPGFGSGDHPSEALVKDIIPDVTLSATALLDHDELDDKGEPTGKVLPGLGTLVLRQIGEDPRDHEALLSKWAGVILALA
jgi:hypothetical protein